LKLLLQILLLPVTILFLLVYKLLGKSSESLNQSLSNLSEESKARHRERLKSTISQIELIYYSTKNTASKFDLGKMERHYFNTLIELDKSYARDNEQIMSISERAPRLDLVGKILKFAEQAETLNIASNGGQHEEYQRVLGRLYSLHR